MATTYEKRQVELDTAANEAPVVYMVQWWKEDGTAIAPPQVYQSVNKAFLDGRKRGTELLRRLGKEYFSAARPCGRQMMLRTWCIEDINDEGQARFDFKTRDGDIVGGFSVTEMAVL